MANKKIKTQEQIVEEIVVKIEKKFKINLSIDERAYWYDFLNDKIDDATNTFTNQVLGMIPNIKFKY